MPVSTVSAKGQLTLPAQVRRKLRIQPNDRVTIEVVGDAIVVKRAPDFFALKGFLGKALLAVEERDHMRRGVAAHAKNKAS
jgi:AbrB family looped-hinge helix DNA binding protein